MSEQSDERIAPVAYLPWVVPSSEESERGGTAPARRASRHPAGRGLGGPPPTRLAVVGESDAEGEAQPGGLASAEPVETGVERDARIDRLIVSRLRRSSLSIAEVRAALVEHGLDDHEVEEWIERYERLGYLDDRRLAEQLVHSHGVRRGRGSGALLSELGRRGVDTELAREALDALDPEVELEHATQVAVRRARQLAGLDRMTAERRLSAFLLRRGYGSDLVRRAVAAALEGEPTG
ncbi:regulatory protein RecX [Agromyces aurantiacus]|uniref:Regulatory protein RecX n=1 Tax=Agromyces aurantiacus TaxID=165814 RepID=A0ABV9R886_9MICO|nr:RecX family transcriptional regulator [Agromyces aurantiacus]MBM7504478.1 regulatory protein [Agromyces aurantiacus]